MALPSYSDIVELIKKGATLEAQEKVMQLREAALKLQEENISLKEQISKLEEHLTTKSKLTYDGHVYWLLENGNREGPYCQRCYDTSRLIIRLQRRGIDDIDQDSMRVIKNAHYYYHCLNCDSRYEMPRA